MLGTADDNLRVLNNLLDAETFARGNVVTVTGPDYEVVWREESLDESKPLRDEVIRSPRYGQAHRGYDCRGCAGVGLAGAGRRYCLASRQARASEDCRSKSEYVQAIDDNTIVFGIDPLVPVRLIWPWPRPCKRYKTSKSAALS